MAELKQHYQSKVVPALMKELGLKNPYAVPALHKVVLNIGLGRSLTDKTFVETATSTLQRITGQKPVLTKAKKSISNFKIREGMVVGAKVTLRGPRMYDFIDKLVNIAFPRVRDFHGLDKQKGFDGRGNYVIGFKEHIVFPEIKSDEVEKLHGLEIAVNTSARDDKSCRALLIALGFPFKR